MMKKHPTSSYTQNTGRSIPTSFRVVPAMLITSFNTELAAPDTSVCIPLYTWKCSCLSLGPPPPSLFWNPLGFTHPLRPGSDCILSQLPAHFSYWNESPTCLAPTPHPTLWLELPSASLLDFESLWRAGSTVHPVHTPPAPTWQSHACFLVWLLAPFVSPTGF